MRSCRCAARSASATAARRRPTPTSPAGTDRASRDAVRGDGIDTTADSQLAECVARLRAIPDAARELAVAPQQAAREYDVDAALAARLVAAGLPHAAGDDGPRFWRTDLHYVALRLGRTPVYRGVLNRWAGALTALSARETTEVEIRCRAYAPKDVAVELLAPGGARLRAEPGEGAAPLRFTAVVPGGVRVLADPPAAALRELLTDLASYDFCWLEPPLESDLAFVRRTRLANCLSTARLLVEEAARLGVEARLAHGLLVAPPYSTPHNWAEVRTDGAWLPLDPLLLGLLARFAELDAAAWPPERSPGAVLLRLTEPGTAIVTAATTGVPLEATFLTKAFDAP